MPCRADGWTLRLQKPPVSLEKRTGAVVVMTGTADVVAGPGRVMKIMNGHPWMGRITGSGCMLDKDRRGFLRIVRTCTGKDSGRMRREGSVKGAAGMPQDAAGRRRL